MVINEGDISPICILVVEKEKDIYNYIKRVLNKKNFKIFLAKNKEEAIKLLKDKTCEIIITETEVAGLNDYEVIKNVKDTHSESCVIVTSGCSSLHEALQSLKSGAYDFIPKPFDDETIKIILNKAIERQSLYRERNHYQKLSLIDSLTEVFNRRQLQVILSCELARSHRFSHNLSILILDIDNFKSINDTYGHLVGDYVLKRFAQILVENVRNIDYICRYGGDEFVVILPETTKEGAYNLARRLKNSIMQTKFYHEEKKESYISLSVGIASFPKDTKEKDELLGKADIALYDAKKLGKNRICLFSDEK